MQVRNEAEDTGGQRVRITGQTKWLPLRISNRHCIDSLNPCRATRGGPTQGAIYRTTLQPLGVPGALRWRCPRGRAPDVCFFPRLEALICGRSLALAVIHGV